MSTEAAKASGLPQSIGPTAAEVDASFRWMAPFFVAKSVFWLALGSLLSLLASVKLHAPAMLSSTAWLTYGRLLPAGWDAMVYGFAAQAGSAVGLWLLAHAVRQKLQAPWAAITGGVCWNLGVLAGTIGILAGNSTGREWLEMPAGAMWLLVIGAGLIAASAWLTFASRTEDHTYPSAWFVLLASLASVWFGTATLLLFRNGDLQGVLQVLVQRWFAGGFLRICLAGFALAVIFHCLPRLVDRPLASRQLALWGFWGLTFFAPWAITAHGDPFPRWIISLGLAGQTFSMIAVLAIALNWWKTLEGTGSVAGSSPTGKLVLFAAAAYLAANAIQFVVGLRAVASSVRLTWVHQGIDWLFVGGAVIIALLAVLPEFMERTIGQGPAPGLVAAQAWLSVIGVVLIALPLMFAGLLQGAGLGDTTASYLDVLRRTLHLVRVSSLGFTAFFLGQFILVIGMIRPVRFLAGGWAAVAKGWSEPPMTKRAEARS